MAPLSQKQQPARESAGRGRGLAFVALAVLAACVLAGGIALLSRSGSEREASPPTAIGSATSIGSASQSFTFARALPRSGSHRRRTFDTDVKISLKVDNTGVHTAREISKTVLDEVVEKVSDSAIQVMTVTVTEDEASDQSVAPSKTRKVYKGQRYTIAAVRESDGKPLVLQGFDPDLSGKPMPFGGSHRGGDMATWIEREFIDDFYLWIADPDLVAIPVPKRPLSAGDAVPELIEPLRDALQRYLLDPLWATQRGDSAPSDTMIRGTVTLREADPRTGTFCFEYGMMDKSGASFSDGGTKEFSGCARIRRADSSLEDLDATGRASAEDPSSKSWSKTEQHLHTSISEL